MWRGTARANPDDIGNTRFKETIEKLIKCVSGVASATYKLVSRTA